MAKQAIVVGAGLGGLSAAIHLRLSGFEVSIFEQNSRPGGKMNQFAAGGYRFDTGPSLLTLPSVIDALFTRAGLERNDFLEFELVEPICRYFWDDGQRLDAGKDVEAMKAELARISPADVWNVPRGTAVKNGHESCGAFADIKFKDPRCKTQPRLGSRRNRTVADRNQHGR